MTDLPKHVEVHEDHVGPVRQQQEGPDLQPIQRRFDTRPGVGAIAGPKKAEFAAEVDRAGVVGVDR